jgi:hypothetical protein
VGLDFNYGGVDYYCLKENERNIEELKCKIESEYVNISIRRNEMESSKFLMSRRSLKI